MKEKGIVLKIKEDLHLRSNPEKIPLLQRFFKTAKGQYGEGDVFAGITVPNTRIVAKKYSNCDLDIVEQLLYSKVHEERLCALLILVQQFKKSEEKERKNIFNFYIKHSKQANNWDLVDLSAHKICGEYLLDKNKKILYKFATSKSLWQRRIAIISTFAFINKKFFNDSIKIAQILLKDKEDLIQKAVGWMLREVGKRNLELEESFLKENIKLIPRMTLRYAIERFPEIKRKKYLFGKII